MAALIMRRASVQFRAVKTNSLRCFAPLTVTVAQNRYCCMIRSFDQSFFGFPMRQPPPLDLYHLAAQALA